MKNIIILLAFALSTISAEAQIDSATTSHKFDANTLSVKSRNQKTMAWLLLAGGTTMFIIGGAIAGQEVSDQITADLTTIFTLGIVAPKEVKHSSAAPILSITGAAAMLGSIPFFISAHKNKNAAKFILKNESAFFNPKTNIGRLPSMGIQINF